MSDARNSELPADIDFATEEHGRRLYWRRARGQWPIGPALAVVGTLSLTIWSGILFLLLA